MKTQLSHLRRALEASEDKGFGTSVVRQGWAVMGICVAPRNPPARIDDQDWLRVQSNLLKRAGFDVVRHRLVSMWSWLAWDAIDPLVGAVPFGAYPFDADLCAELTCGYVMFQTHMSERLVDDALTAHGFRTRWHLKDSNDAPKPSDRVISITRRAADGMRGIDIQMSGFHSLLIEFLEPDRYAAALREMFDQVRSQFPVQAPAPGEWRHQLAKGTLALSNEKAIWFKNR
jgi:hypothetical protein